MTELKIYSRTVDRQNSARLKNLALFLNNVSNVGCVVPQGNASPILWVVNIVGGQYCGWSILWMVNIVGGQYCGWSIWWVMRWPKAAAHPTLCGYAATKG
jgi:hypothetical protein